VIAILGVVAGLLLSATLPAHAAALTVEILDADLPASGLAQVRASAPSDWHAFSDGPARVLPLRKHGTWLRVHLPDRTPHHGLLTVDSMVAAPVTLVLPSDRTIVRSKLEPEPDGIDGSSVSLLYPLPVEASAGSTLLLHLEHRHRALVRIELRDYRHWIQHERDLLVLIAVLATALIAFALVALCYWAVLRERLFSDYAWYMLSLMGFLLASSGVLYALPGGAFFAWFGVQGQWAMVFAAIGFALGFAGGFLDVAHHAPRLRRPMNVARSTILLLAAGIALTPVMLPIGGVVTSAAVMVHNLFLLGLGLHVALAGNRYGVYFLIGWVPLLLATTLRGLQAAGVWEPWPGIERWFCAAAVWEGLVLTLGIADRVLGFRRERDQAVRAAEEDALTGLRNRRALEADMIALANAARARGTALAALFIDLDRLKAINDAYGHAAGDRCLQAVAERIAAELRESDRLGRWGGDEFIALLPGANRVDATRIGERVRARVATDPITNASGTIPLSVSIGIAMVDDSDDSGRDLIARADKALYEAKSAGRDRVVGA